MTRLVISVLLSLTLCSTAIADPAPAAPPAKLIVGTRTTPPFAMKGDDGQWTGISIELWKMLAADMHVDYEIREYDLKGLLAAVEAKQIDVAVSTLTITAEREEKFDFSHPFFSTGLSIATRPGGHAGTLTMLAGLFTFDMLKLLGVLVVLLVVMGAIMWLVERRANQDHFGGAAAHGLGAGIWWSAVTMTTVGYGDKSPVTLLGRLIGLIWMFAAIIIIAFFTASVTSTLTVDRLESSIKGPEDLPHVRVATVGGSTSAIYLDAHHVAYTAVKSVLEGEQAVLADQVDAMVYDAPLLQYTSKHDLGDQLMVLPNVFDHQDYGFAVPDGSSLREPLNRVLLKELGSENWRALVERYLGNLVQ